MLAALSIGFVGLGVTSASAVEPKLVVQKEADSATSLDVSWSEVKDAASYRIRYSTDDAFKKSIKSVPDVTKGTETTLTGLDTGDTYYVQVTALDAKGATLGASTVMAASTSYPYTSPGDIFATKVTSSSMTLSWKAVSNAAGKAPGYLVDVTRKGTTTTKATTTNSVDLTKLSKDADYDVKVRAAKGSAALGKNSPTQTFSTSEYATATPDHLTQTKQRSTSIDLSWDAVAGLAKGEKYAVEYADNGSFKKSKTVPTAAAPFGRLKNLKTDKTYYACVFVIDAKGKRISAKTDLVVIKTLVPRGTLKGDTSGADPSDLVAVAYTSTGQSAEQVQVGSGGRYELDVRPGKYKVQIQYIGRDNRVTTFAHTSGTGATISSGNSYTVKEGDDTTVTDVTIRQGNVVKGTATSGSKKIRDVDVTAITAVNPGKAGQEREVLGMTRTDKNGNFTITGLADGPYYIRFHYAGTTGVSYKTVTGRVDLDSAHKTSGVVTEGLSAKLKRS